MTKLEMSRIIVASLYMMDDLPSKDNYRVKRQMKKKKVDLEYHFPYAIAVGVQSNKTWVKGLEDQAKYLPPYVEGEND